MHTWLPDAHAEAPSPASAMLSAALLNTGMYAIIRFLAIARAGLGEEFPRVVLLVFGFLSVVIGVLFMVRRGNFKRLFAYSSVEHMGIIAVALGFGGVLGLYGALLHTLNHAIAKAVLFLNSGDVALRYKTREAAGVRGLLAVVPLTGGALLLGSFADTGLAAVRAVPVGVHHRQGRFRRSSARRSRCCCSACWQSRSSRSPGPRPAWRRASRRRPARTQRQARTRAGQPG